MKNVKEKKTKQFQKIAIIVGGCAIGWTAIALASGSMLIGFGVLAIILICLGYNKLMDARKRDQYKRQAENRQTNNKPDKTKAAVKGKEESEAEILDKEIIERNTLEMERKEKEEMAFQMEHFHETSQKTNVVELIESTDSYFFDIKNKILSDKEDGISGEAVHYNYVKLRENVSIVEAVEYYIYISEVLNLPGHELSDWKGNRRFLINKYKSYLWNEYKCMNLWEWWEEKGTFFFVEESNLQVSDEELEQLFILCRRNGIHIILHGFSLTERKYLYIEEFQYPGSADDAATYVDYRLKWVDGNEYRLKWVDDNKPLLVVKIN